MFNLLNVFCVVELCGLNISYRMSSTFNVAESISMKRYCLFALMLLSLNTGCIFGRSDGRPGYFSNLYNRLHGNNVGAPCASGMCAQPMPMQAPPVMPQAMVTPGCDGCGGTSSLGYPEYSEIPSYETYGEPVYSGETVSPQLQPIQSGAAN
jgi:hypothetical protein